MSTRNYQKHGPAPFPSAIESQPRNVTFLTIKTVVRKIQKNNGHGQTGSCAWIRQCLDKGGGGSICTRIHQYYCHATPLNTQHNLKVLIKGKVVCTFSKENLAGEIFSLSRLNIMALRNVVFAKDTELVFPTLWGRRLGRDVQCQKSS